jgi:hypothetical protein
VFEDKTIKGSLTTQVQNQLFGMLIQQTKGAILTSQTVKIQWILSQDYH